MRLYTLDGKCNISGERIKSARAKAKLTQDQLAARLQVAGLQMGQMAISRIESGKRLATHEGGCDTRSTQRVNSDAHVVGIYD